MIGSFKSPSRFLGVHWTGKGKALIWAAAILSHAYTVALSSETGSSGTIQGRVTNRATKEPIPLATVATNVESYGAVASEEGGFVIRSVPAGSYLVTFRSLGFKSETRTDVIVRPGRITFLDAELVETSTEVEGISVRPKLFDQDASAAIGNRVFNSEEIRRSPGSVGDVSRLLKALPSVAQVADNFNDLMVRGGSPIENGFYLDNILVPNVNHFPVVGASGGPIGMLNVDFIDDISFSAGGFPSTYGDRMSSITEIDYRAGNREEFDAQLDMNFAGFGGILEGPIDKQGSFFLSLRRSYLDFIIGAIGTGFVPRYGDFQGKLTYDLSRLHQIEVLNLAGTSSFEFKKDDAQDDGQPGYGDYEAYQNTAGLTWRYLWGKAGYSITSLSHSWSGGAYDFFDVNTDSVDLLNDYDEHTLRLRNVNTWHPGQGLTFEFGVEGEYALNTYRYTYGATINRLGDTLAELAIQDKIELSKPSGFLSATLLPLEDWSITAGGRIDYFSLNQDALFSPRISSRLRVSDKLSLFGAIGRYHQTLPSYLISQNAENRKLTNPKATHYLAGIDYLLDEGTQITVEAYDKEYRDFPMDADDPSKFVLDDGSSLVRFDRYGPLTALGEAFTRGVEVLLQKKLAREFYGLVGGAVFSARYKDLNGVWRDRAFDNRYLFSVIGGYRPSKLWEISGRWNYAGGVPYSPYDISASTAVNSGIVDELRINGERFDDYHSLNLRFDRRFLFRNSSLVTYLSIWNVYNRENVAFNYWNTIDNEPDSEQQWSFLPVVGIEYEF